MMNIEEVNPETEAFDEATEEDFIRAEREGIEAMNDDLRIAAIFADKNNLPMPF